MNSSFTYDFSPSLKRSNFNGICERASMLFSATPAEKAKATWHRKTGVRRTAKLTSADKAEARKVAKRASKPAKPVADPFARSKKSDKALAASLAKLDAKCHADKLSRLARAGETSQDVEKRLKLARLSAETLGEVYAEVENPMIRSDATLAADLAKPAPSDFSSDSLREMIIAQLEASADPRERAAAKLMRETAKPAKYWTTERGLASAQSDVQPAKPAVKKPAVKTAKLALPAKPAVKRASRKTGNAAVTFTPSFTFVCVGDF